ncbi:hypothetical protein D3C72_1238320 [compost metagenome]
MKRYNAIQDSTAQAPKITNSQRHDTHSSSRVPTSGPSSGDSRAILASKAIIRTASASLNASFKAG